MISQLSKLTTNAVFSDDKKHCFLLYKEWDKNKKTAMIIMKNPSHSDAVKIDATIMYIINNLADMDFGAVYIVNLFSIVSNKIRFWHKTLDDLVTPENDSYMCQVAAKADSIILAWGKDSESNKQVMKRKVKIMELLAEYKYKFYIINDAYGHKCLHPSSSYLRDEWVLEKVYQWEAL